MPITSNAIVKANANSKARYQKLTQVLVLLQVLNKCKDCVS